MSDLKHDVVAERWAMLIKERAESGMTVREWRHDRNIKESRYYYWLRILRRKGSVSKRLPFSLLRQADRPHQRTFVGRRRLRTCL